MEGNSRGADQLSDGQTCSRFIAAVSAREMPDNHNVQMCVCSVGFDIEGVVAALLHQRMRQQRARRVYCVVVPENLPPGSVSRLAKAIERHLHRSAQSANVGQATNAAGADSVEVQCSAAPPPTSASSLCASVVAIEEGTGTKERCAIFQRGAVVLLTSRSLCADLLHRRLAVELVGMAVLLLPHGLLSGARVQDALAPQTAFCAELLLRSSKVNSAGLTNTERHTPPPIVVLSDAPMLMQSLVQRHHMGAERFVQQLHIGDIQLFPRFRLDFVRHFEELSSPQSPRGRPLEVDRVVAPVSPSVLALDGLLAKIVLETLQELQRLEQQMHAHQQQQAELSGLQFAGGEGGLPGSSSWSPAARRAAAAAEADEGVGVQRFLPRARFTATTLNGHLDYSGYPRSGPGGSGGGPTSAVGGGGGSSSYVRQSWRVAKDEKGIWFNGITEAAALAMDFTDLDSDLRAVVRRHESSWPYRLLTESLIDVRRLRRATRGTAFSFFLHLESVLEKRLPQRSVYGTGARPPAALWTLSSHFNDVVTVATHRIGTVVYTNAPKAAVPHGVPSGVAKAASDTVVVVDSSDDDDVEVDGVVDATTNTNNNDATVTVQVPQLVPNTEEQETDVEVVVRLVMSWCRTILRRRAARKLSRHKAASKSGQPSNAVDVADNAESSATTTTGTDGTSLPASPTASPTSLPTLLLLTFGAGAVVRYTERLAHDRVTYQRLQLRRFMEVYQAKYGVQLQTCAADATSASANAGDTVTKPNTAFAATAPPEAGGNGGASTPTDAAAAAAVEEQLKTAFFEADNPDDAYSEEEGEEVADVEGRERFNSTSGGDDGRLAGIPRKLLRPRGGSMNDRAFNPHTNDNSAKKEGGVEARVSQADPSALYGDGGGGPSAFHQALLTQVAPLDTQEPQEHAPSMPASKSAEATGEKAKAAQDEHSDPFASSETTAAASGGAASAVTAALTLCVERVRAGAVTLLPLLQDDETEPASGHGTRGAADGVPRVLILDGSQLSAAELAMLLDGSHEALSLSVPPTAASTASATPSATTGATTPAVNGEQGEQVTGNDANSTHAAAGVASQLAVERLILSRQQLSILRQLEMAQDELSAACLRRLKVQLITTSLAAVDFKKAVQAEQLAFESLAHTKATLTGTLLVDQSSLRQTEEALESGLQVARRRGALRKGSQIARLEGQFFSDKSTNTYAAAPPCVIFDEREFRSTLPYDLYKRGVDLVPLTLTTADYVLSPDYAVERKSVLDYFQSVMSGRIQHQLAALSRKYTNPMCLIEFHRGIPFRLLQNRIYGRTAKLMANYPRVSFLWARSPAHAAGMLVSLKKSVAVPNADPSDPSLTGSSMDPSSAAEAGGLAASASEREAAHYAARVLSRFPGITHQNAPRVMQLCGSLIGLATISQSSLAAVMEEEDAEKLYNFLHAPFHERVD